MVERRATPLMYGFVQRSRAKNNQSTVNYTGFKLALFLICCRAGLRSCIRWQPREVGNITFFGCVVVSTMTRLVDIGDHELHLIAASNGGWFGDVMSVPPIRHTPAPAMSLTNACRCFRRDLVVRLVSG